MKSVESLVRSAGLLVALYGAFNFALGIDLLDNKINHLPVELKGVEGMSAEEFSYKRNVHIFAGLGVFVGGIAAALPWSKK